MRCGASAGPSVQRPGVPGQVELPARQPQGRQSLQSRPRPVAGCGSRPGVRAASAAIARGIACAISGWANSMPLMKSTGVASMPRAIGLLDIALDPLEGLRAVHRREIGIRVAKAELRAAASPSWASEKASSRVRSQSCIRHQPRLPSWRPAASTASAARHAFVMRALGADLAVALAAEGIVFDDEGDVVTAGHRRSISASSLRQYGHS